MGDYNRPLSLNRWMYVEGNPVNFADPSGLGPCDKLPLGERDLCEMDTPDTTHYNQKIHPRGISWVSNPLANKIARDLAPIFNRAGNKVVNTNAAQFKIGGIEVTCDPDFSTKDPFDCIPGSTRNQNYCGDIAISAILHTEYSNITAAEVANDLRNKMYLDRSSTTGYPPLADYINNYYGNVFRAAIVVPPSAPLSMLSTWIREQMKSGKVIMIAATIYQGTSGENLDPISGADRSGQISTTGRDIGHWIIITGISAQWESSANSPWNWIRIANPFDNQTEYYWWNDFHLAWKENVPNYKAITVEN